MQKRHCSQQSKQQQQQINCYNCKKHVSQPDGTRRTICPYCGSLFAEPSHQSPAATPPPLAAAAATEDSSRRPSSSTTDSRVDSACSSSSGRVDSASSTRRSSSGSGNKIVNFFANLGKSKPKSATTAGGKPGRKDGNLPLLSHSPSGSLATAGGNGKLRPKALSPLTPTSVSYGGLHKAQSVTSLLTAPVQQIQARTPSPRQEYPPAQLNESLLQDLLTEARSSGSWEKLSDMFELTFSSTHHLVAAFKQKEPDAKKSGLDQQFIESAYAALQEMPYEMQKKVLKSNISVLLQKRHSAVVSKDEVRAYFIILQNPLFEKVNTFVLLAHLLRCIAALPDFDHHCLVNWLAWLKRETFESLIRRVQYFISVRLFPPKPEDLPPMSKATWWVPNAVKVLALLNAANNVCGVKGKVPYTEFYNITIDSLDLLAEYYSWQNSSSSGFTFCQYPFIISIAAKRQILQRDSESQMIMVAKRSLVASVAKRNAPNMDTLFLNICVRRSNLVSDSLRQISAKQRDLKKKLRVTFEGEAGLDMGGLTKEWFLLVTRSIFMKNSGLFTYNSKSRVFWFSLGQRDNPQEYFLIGALMGLAVYNGINLDIKLPTICYKKLLSPSVVPQNAQQQQQQQLKQKHQQQQQQQQQLGICPVTLYDLRDVMPELAHGLHELLKYDGNVEEDFSATFEVSYMDCGKTRTAELKSNGKNIPVTNDNRREYVALYTDFLLNRAVASKFRNFYLGFHQVCASNALILLRPEEVEQLVCGSPKFDFNELRKVTNYEGFRINDAQVKWFWDIAINFPSNLQASLLLFITGSDRIPVGGMSEMQLKIIRCNNVQMLPVAHTCFNQIMLPCYKTKVELKTKLQLAIENSEGFGLE